MTCNGFRELLHPYFDSELVAERAAAGETHVQDCPACARELEEQRAVRAALTDESFRYRAPPELAGRLLAQLPAPSETSHAKRWRFAITAAAAVVLGIA